MNIARPNTWRSSGTHLNQEPDKVASPPERFEVKSRIDQQRVPVAAPHISPTARMICFERFVDEVCYLSDSIQSQAVLKVWDRIEQVLYDMRPTELHFSHGIWTLTGVVDNEVIKLKLSCLDVVCEYQPS